MSDAPKDPDRQKICDALFAGQKIEAIKLYRQMAGAGLKDAKVFVDALEAVLRKEQPERFAKPEGQAGGCQGALLLLLGIIALAVVWWLVSK